MRAAAPALRCRICEHVERRPTDTACSRCDGPTDVAYDLAALAELMTPARIAAGPEAMWRYRDLLPDEVGRATSPVGWTPLAQAEILSRALDIELRLKVETLNPTGSYKDRTAALAATAAVSCGLRTLCCASDGPVGNAVAAEALGRGLEAIVLIPETASSAHAPALACGAQLIAIDAPLEVCEGLAAQLSTLFPWGFVAGNLRPYAVEGSKTIAFEIAEQLGWRLPAVVVTAIASGTLFAKLAQGFHELRAVGLVHGPSPRLIGAQSSTCAPVAAAYAEGRARAFRNPAYGDLAIGAARASGGAVFAVDERLVGGYRQLVDVSIGERVDESAGVALGAVVQGVRLGAIHPGETVVVVVSGSASDDVCARATRTIPPRLDRVLEELGAS